MRRTAAATAVLAWMLAAHAQTPPDTAPPPPEPVPAAAPASEPATPAEAAGAATTPSEHAPPAPRPAAAPKTAPNKTPAAAPPDTDREAEVAALRQEVGRLQAALDAERAAAVPAPEEATPAPPPAANVWGWLALAAVLGLAAGFALGWRVLDRRMRAKFGGLRIF